nr:hypothetical protein [Pandoravirus aubagnensis]
MEREDETPTGLASLPVELVSMIVNGRDRHGRAFLDPRWRCMARMAFWLLRHAVENPTPWDADALGDPQSLFRRPMVGAGDTYVELNTPHARRRRWRRGAIVCASVVAEWLRNAPGALTQHSLDALANRMVAEWGASRAAAHLAILATDRADAIAYALDPTTSAAFAPIPATPDYPHVDIIAYDPRWSPDGQALAYAMTDVAVRRCACATMQAALSAIDAAPWMLYDPRENGGNGDGYDDDDDEDGDDVPGSDARRGMHRLNFSGSVLAFDRDDIIAVLGTECATGDDLVDMLVYGAARCMARYISSQGVSAADPASAHRLLGAVAQWSRGEYYADDMGLNPSAAYVLREIPAGVLGTEHIVPILLAAIQTGDIESAVWALNASGYAQVSADALLTVSGLTATGLMEHALGSYKSANQKRLLKAGMGRHAGGARSAAWLCDVLVYSPTHDDLSKLVTACIARSKSDGPFCCVARAIFLLERWPLALWETRDGVHLVRDAFVSCMTNQQLGRDAIDLADAVETWSDTVGVERADMRDLLALFCSVACRGGSSSCLKGITSALYGIEFAHQCSSVCYGTCRAALPDTTTAPLCNGRDRSDADRIVSWCLPNFSATRWRV